MENSSYLQSDRRHALTGGHTIPERTLKRLEADLSFGPSQQPYRIPACFAVILGAVLHGEESWRHHMPPPSQLSAHGE